MTLYIERLRQIAKYNGRGRVYVVALDRDGELRQLSLETTKASAIEAMRYYYDTSLSKAEQARYYVRVFCLKMCDVELDEYGELAFAPWEEVASV